MDSKRLTDERLTDERVKDLLGFLSDLGCSIIYQELRETCDIIVALRELLLLRADAAELARLAQVGYELSRYAAAIHWDGRRNEQDWLDGLRDDIEKLQKTAEPLLSRPSVVNLLKEKDQ